MYYFSGRRSAGQGKEGGLRCRIIQEHFKVNELVNNSMERSITLVQTHLEIMRILQYEIQKKEDNHISTPHKRHIVLHIIIQLYEKLREHLTVFVYRCTAYLFKSCWSDLNKDSNDHIWFFLKSLKTIPIFLWLLPQHLQTSVMMWEGGGCLSIKILWSLALIQGAKNSKLLIKKDLLAFNLMVHLLK